MRIKETLNLNKTGFPMRGNLPVTEAQRQAVWAENKVYEQRQKLNEGKPTFVLHDGPPYANGDIHIGHAMNKISKDFIVRYKSMSGYRAPYVPGWDTHGLPTEQALTNQGVDRKSMSTAEFRELCRKFVLKEIDKQRNGFKRLGVAGDWDHPYITLQPEYEAAQVRVFAEFVKKGYIFRGQKPVYWSWSSESALAEAEVDYKDVESPSAFFAEQVKDGHGLLDDNTYFVVWTTTPWTIPASEGITVDAGFDYAVVQPKGETRKFVVAEQLLSSVSETLGWEDVKTLQTLKGAQLEKMTAHHPYYDRDLLVMNGNFVTLDAGTGLVHTAPGFGEDDFNVGTKYGLPVFSPVDGQGKMTADAPGFEGVFYEDANQISLDKLKEKNLLLKYMPYTHSYPFDWRTKKPIIFRATPQWFASVSAFRQDILDALDDVKFYPDWGKRRLYNMIKDRGDWVISRQRAWGVPLPIFYAEDGTPIMTPETIDHVADLFAKHGSNYWFEHDAKELLPDGFTSEHSPNGQFTKETDIMDVWFDSGSSHQAVLAARPELTYPADLYLEGSDQYRGWFNSSLITSVAVSGKAPYKAVMSQGFTLDKNGKKMSKSIGNTIAPDEIIKKMGAEILRLWVASVDSSADVRVSMESFTQISESYRKLRNTMRFMLSNVTDFDPAKNTVPYADLAGADRYLLSRLNDLVEQVRADYEKYDFIDLYKLLLSFVTNDLSAFYLDFAKDILYIDAADSKTRRSMQTVLYQVLVRMTTLMTPLLPHTAEEIWPFLHEKPEFAQLAEMPNVEPEWQNEALIGRWADFMTLRSDVLKSLEEARDAKLIGRPMEAALDLYVSDHNAEMLEHLHSNVAQLLIVSQLQVHPLSEAPETADKYEDVAVVVSHATGDVCQRCRMIKQDVGSDDAYPALCARCAKIVRAEYPESVTEGLEK
ncbi:MAG: isoleucine--tRNA ligase [Furfurilactobacillus sp.]|jgi:isoleucyl-tRNA synthetase|uniref:Isoleucine--tRNA ligase n=1 Tax=Furfurilactobacillus milii TaxID=2888272 RepID=A0ABT6D8R4_9LACO|nr:MULTISPECIES: isoleucine--tRNA ligase [Furfurilactobacillus]QLE66252.1 Isoleucyl-tRNA synthetase [Furfurilactobacillus rossiae]MCF6159710.1 isoleucine--tRNA ligase [Furfurilactobacillus milii]MCF6163205.1 isoleucine--tRNA ligase [Furfurilactobacillus milii]MCF6420458.1 isoleucine--tRNA ligase [Furfurilactobacillus milii]MCH4011035.1 isoleucine--tRNA ligase [Furfurilactobacillus sp.]